MYILTHLHNLCAIIGGIIINLNGDSMDNNLKTVRINGVTYEKLRKLKYYTNQNFIDIIDVAIKDYMKRLEREGKMK